MLLLGFGFGDFLQRGCDDLERTSVGEGLPENTLDRCSTVEQEDGLAGGEAGRRRGQYSFEILSPTRSCL